MSLPKRLKKKRGFPPLHFLVSSMAKTTCLGFEHREFMVRGKKQQHLFDNGLLMWEGKDLASVSTLSSKF